MIALSAAAIHGFTYAVRRKEPAHLWLAVSALGILAIAISTALLYEVRTAADGEFWQRVMLGAAAPALLGFHYFSLSLLEVERSRLDRWFGFGAGAMVLQLFWPGSFSVAPRSNAASPIWIYTTMRATWAASVPRWWRPSARTSFS